MSAANLVQQPLRAGHPDEIEPSEVPYLFAAACVGGTTWTTHSGLRQSGVNESTGVTHLRLPVPHA